MWSVHTLQMIYRAANVSAIAFFFTVSGSAVLQYFTISRKAAQELKCVPHRHMVSQYIGEICRYLLNTPKVPEETQHSVQIMIGNGLRPYLWEEFQERFKIKKIIEFYGVTEGNTNIVNLYGKTGACGFISRIFFRIHAVYLIKVNPETGEVIRGSDGLCVRCKAGEPGEIVAKIARYSPTLSFDGYTNSAETSRKIIRDTSLQIWYLSFGEPGEIVAKIARYSPTLSFDGYTNSAETSRKIIRDCFRRGDKAFSSGDLLVMDEDGYLYFKDRTGDTFRWRGENVSTSEVENIVSKVMNHTSCIVFGVAIPNVEGRAGMAAIQADVKDVDLKEIHKAITERLPPYAVPLFIRFSSDIEVTGTHKFRKTKFKEEGYNLEEVKDPLYMLDFYKKEYVPFTKEIYHNLNCGKIKL